jgi:hypothetical protein
VILQADIKEPEILFFVFKENTPRLEAHFHYRIFMKINPFAADLSSAKKHP